MCLLPDSDSLPTIHLSIHCNQLSAFIIPKGLFNVEALVAGLPTAETTDHLHVLLDLSIAFREVAPLLHFLIF